MKVQEALEQLKKDKRKFDQSVDLIVNLKKFDLKRNAINILIRLPHKIKEVKIAGFLEKESKLIDSVTEKDFKAYKKSDIKKLGKRYDFLIANAKLMPKIATTFGRYLGPIGKMPSPQTGILAQENEEEIKKIITKLEKAVRIKTKEPSIKIVIGKQSMKKEELEENIKEAFSKILDALPNKKENVKSVLIKLSMSKPLKIDL